MSSLAPGGSGVALTKLAVTLTSLTALIAFALADQAALNAAAGRAADVLFSSRGWFVMATTSLFLMLAGYLCLSRFGRVRLGPDDSQPDFSLISWLAMLFAAGMGVGLLFWGTAEPLSHFALARRYLPDNQAATQALFITQFNWGIHAWGIYAVTGLVLAYTAFRRNRPMTLTAVIEMGFPGDRWTGPVGWVLDTLALFAVAIGLGGSIAMGVFQIVSGLEALVPPVAGPVLPFAILAVLVLVYTPALVVDLSRGMSVLSNLAMALAGALMLVILITGPTGFLMSTLVQSIGEYADAALVQGLRTYSVFDPEVESWFHDWTLSYMVWWLAWAPFVGVFIARISRGRTIREFLLGVILAPAGFSLAWFAVFGGIGFYEVLKGPGKLLTVAETQVDRLTFDVLAALPFSGVSQWGVIVAAFLFVVTSVVSAAFVLGMLSARGSLNPPRLIKLVWGGLAAAMGLAMVMVGDMEPVKRVIAIGAMPFVFVLPLMIVSFLRTLIDEERHYVDR